MSRITSLLPATILAAIIMLVPATPAEASWNACTYGRFCMWQNTNYWGVFDEVLYPVGQCIESPQPNGTSAVRNYRPTSMYFYEFAGCEGRGFLVSSWQSYPAVPTPFHDRIRSFFLT